MQRQPFGNARYKENAQLPETFPIVKDASKDYNYVRKRKDTAASQDLRVRRGFDSLRLVVNQINEVPPFLTQSHCWRLSA